MRRFAPEPSEKYICIIEIEKELNRNVSVGDIDYEFLDRVETLRTEQNTLNSEPEIKSERQEFERKKQIADKLVTYSVCPMILLGISVFPFTSGI